jgi:hypothetical protein
MDDTVDPSEYTILEGLKLLVDCGSWGADKALEYFGPDWSARKTEASIKKVSGSKVRSLKFEIYFPELQDSFVNFTWKYVVQYLAEELPPIFQCAMDAFGRKKKRMAKEVVEEQPKSYNKKKK